MQLHIMMDSSILVSCCAFWGGLPFEASSIARSV